MSFPRKCFIIRHCCRVRKQHGVEFTYLKNDKEKYMKNRSKKEWILILTMLIIAFCGIVFMRFSGRIFGTKASVTVSVDGKEYGIYNLNKNQEIEIVSGHGTNVLKIENGQANMISASCPNQICVNMQPLTDDVPGVIVCLPNEVIVELKE